MKSRRKLTSDVSGLSAVTAPEDLTEGMFAESYLAIALKTVQAVTWARSVRYVS